MPTHLLFGNPISHSISPELHAQFAELCGIKIDYKKQLVPLGTFKNAVDEFRAQGGLGANITTPFKIAAFEYADEHTERARLAGAVNTFIFRDDKCIGDNTDGVGLIRDLKNHHIELQGKNILILGAGGAVRGILGEIIREKPCKIMIHNRTEEKIQLLQKQFSDYFLIEKFNSTTKIDLLINATTINFQNDQFNLNLNNTVCYDLNYGQRHDTFYQWATEQQAIKVLSGFGMLVEQAAMSFFQWFGVRPDTVNGRDYCGTVY